MAKRVLHFRDSQGFSWHLLMPAFAIIGVASIGAYLINASHAATPYTTITTSNSSQCMDNKNGKKSTYNEVQIYKCATNNTNQEWTVNAGSTAGSIVNSNGYCLNVYNTGKTVGTPIDIYPCKNSVAQLWTVNTTTGAILNPNSKLCIGYATPIASTGTELVLQTCSSGVSSQQWKFATIGSGTGSGSGSGSDTTTSTATTATTCTSSVQPAAPVTGYTIAECNDFNSSSSMGSGAGEFDPYSGGGAGTVVGVGRTPSECTVTGGVLEEKQASTGATCGGWMNDFGQQYGYWEVKMRAYLTGSGGKSVPHPVLTLWPESGAWTSEFDWFDSSIGNPAEGELHCTSPSGDASGNCDIFPTNSVDYTQYHVFGILWTPTTITGYIDGTKWYSYTNTSNVQPLGASNLTMQVDNLTGQTPVTPGEMDVDWVHMYKAN